MTIAAKYTPGQGLQLPEPVRLDLACGQNKAEGFVGVDAVELDGVDFTCDLSQTPWHFYQPGSRNGLGKLLVSDSVDTVRCSHFFEHLDGPERIGFMNELYRVMKLYHSAEIIVPYGMNGRAVQDPTHKWPPVVENSFLYFYAPWMKANGLDHYPIHCNFWFSYDPIVSEEWDIRSDETRLFAMKHYNNVVSDLRVVLTKLGEGEEGPLEIQQEPPA